MDNKEKCVISIFLKKFEIELFLYTNSYICFDL